MTDVGLAANWHLDSTIRLTINYARSRVADLGQAYVFLVRYGFNP